MLDNRQEIRDLLQEISKQTRLLSRFPQAVKRTDVEDMKSKLGLLLYMITPKEGINSKPAPVRSIGQIECETCGKKLYETLDGRPQLRNVLFNIQNQSNQPHHWRCLEHIPPEITFPIGLHGEEWDKTGRPASGKKV